MLVLLAIVFISSLYRPSPGVANVSYTEFLNRVERDQVASVVIDNLTGVIVAETKDAGNGTTERRLRTIAPEDRDLLPLLKEHKVVIEGKRPDQTNWWVSLLSTILVPVLIIVGLWIFMLRQAQSGSNQAISFGKSRAKMMVDNKPKLTFADVAGIEEAKSELQEIVDFLKSPEKFQALGARIPKGVLLVGAPGTGKTLLAKAIAGEAGVPFFSISGSDFVEMFVGVGASRVRDLFDQAKKHSPCIVFVDEIDAVGRQRGAGLGGGHDEREQTLNQLLVEMDGFEPNTSVIVIAATNRPDILDVALMRPGRFDRQIVVDQPDVKGREEILKVHVKNKPLAAEVDLNILARRTPGFTGADLQNMANEAALLAARYNRKEVLMEDFEQAIDKVIAGPERKSRIITEKEKEIIAYHEVGHALVAKVLPHSDPVHKVTIVSRGMALGLTMTLPEEDRVLTSKSQLLDRITMMLGGQVAERLKFDEITTGASNDLERATEVARRMVTEFGMSDSLGPLTFGKRHEHIFLGRDLGEDRNYSDAVAALIDQEVRRIVESCYERARQILTEQREKLELIARELMKRETLDSEEFNRLFSEGTPAPEPALV
ncbi:MAG: ATP-dependent zinc metalloprotease FtsH [Candidatus Sericytochromatia bacterium]|nr:ATP-dependent zinc metalloprotease FtsH [Candidatus Tanganyikabacteria bacterium]